MEQAPPKGRTPRPLTAWRRYGRTGILIAFIVLILGTPIVWIKAKSVYVSEAIFQVAPTFQKTLSADKDLELQSNSQYREFVNQLSRSALRYDILEKAIHNLNDKGVHIRLPGETERRCIERLQRTIYVYAVADTYMVRLGLQSDSKKNLDVIVNAVMDSFLETTRNEQIYGSDQRSHVLTERAAVLNSEISGFEAERANLAGVLGLTTFGDNTVNPYDAILAQARENLRVASVDAIRAQATLDAFNAQKETPTSFGRSLLDMRLQDNGLQALRNEVIKRNQELERTVAGLQDAHPGKKPALEEEQLINKQLQSAEHGFDKTTQADVRSRLVASQEETAQVQKKLKEHVDYIQSQATGFATTFREAMRLTAEIKKREQELADIRARQNYLETEGSAFGFVRLITPAMPADIPQGIGKSKMLLGLLAVSLLLAVLIPIALDMFDSKLLQVGDAERAMGIPAAAWIVEADESAAKILMQDQFRRFASTLLRNRSRGSRAAFGFSSISVGGGATTITLQMARALQKLGAKVLVVDANSMSLKPPFAGSHSKLGLTDLLASKTTVDNVVHEYRHAGGSLSVVPFGMSADGGIQRLDLMKSALQCWEQHYDIVLIDLPPLLPSADADVLIDTIGQVFVIAHIEAMSKPEVAQARAQLEKLSPEAVGLVVNHVPLEAGGDALKNQMLETITHRSAKQYFSASIATNRMERILQPLTSWLKRRQGENGATLRT